MQSTSHIQIVLNGDSKDVPEGSTIAGLLELLSLDPSRVAVELDRRIVRQPEWASTVLGEGSKVEIVQFVGGG